MAAFNKKTWYNQNETGANANNSVLNKTTMNDLENRIEKATSCKIVTEENTDLDNYKEAGIYFFDTKQKPTNIPAGNNGWLQVFKGSGNFVKQIWFRAGTANTNDYETYVRTNTGSWSNWVKLVSIADYDTKSLNENGYQKLPSGLTLQWGSATAELTATEVTKYITFPVSFSNSCFQVFANLSDVGAQSTTLTSNIGCAEMSKIGANLKIKSTSSYVKDSTARIKWFAIGY